MLLIKNRKDSIQGQMSFTQKELDRLSARDEGWELVWNRLWEALDERIQGLLMRGSAGDSTWELKPKFWMLRDVHMAQDFVCDLLLDFHRKAEAGTLLASFRGEPDQVLTALSSTDFVVWRARDYAARQAKHGITGMPAGGDTPISVHSFETSTGDVVAGISAGESRTGVPVIDRPIEIAWDPASDIDARVRMAALQCWFRLSADQPGRSRLEGDLREHVSSKPGEDAITTLQSHHHDARIRISSRLQEIDVSIVGAPRMHAPKRAELEALRLKLMVALILEPLDRGDVQVLLALPSPEAAYKQLSRYRKSYEELFPCLQELHEAASAGS